MTQGIQCSWSCPDEYDQAVEAAGVTELPAERSAPRGLPDEIAGGRWEDREPPVVPR